jgi:acetoacetyl-CoA synthetase
MGAQSVREGSILWEPTEESKNRAVITQYLRWLESEQGLSFKDYDSLWQWSVTEIEAFWQSLWHFFDIQASKPYSGILSGRKMPGANWFAGAELNYAEHVFRQMSSRRPALLFQSEITPLSEVSWETLYRQVTSVATALRELGLKPGDRVVAYMPNIPQTLVAFLACASIGAVWSSCSPDFGTRSVIDRFKQIGPRVLFAVDGYPYGGKTFDLLPAVGELQRSLATLEKTVLVPYLNPAAKPDGLERMSMWDEIAGQQCHEFAFEQVPFSHPLWVVYSSGTTGLPKGLVHGHGGILLEFMKFSRLHMNIGPGERFFWFSTTGWVMWNILQGSLLQGATPVLYDGSPGYPDLDVLWDLAARAKINFFGTSAAYLTGCMQAGLAPGEKFDLQSLKAIGSTGSPLPVDGFSWVYERVKRDILLGSTSGGTDPCTGFLGACPLLPVRAGELQCHCLGISARAFDESGRELIDEVGELVITEPMPSMPLYLWNDAGHARYLASYFDVYPGVWRHGDWVRFTARGSGVILGRSDSTINRLGVRMGSSEIYAVVEDLAEVSDSLVIGLEMPNGGYLMPLFVVLADSVELNEGLKKKVNSHIRSRLSPRHVPDEIYAISGVPRTLNGKKLEVPVKKILAGVPLDEAVNRDSMANPDSIGYFVELAEKLNLQQKC